MKEAYNACTNTIDHYVAVFVEAPPHPHHQMCNNRVCLQMKLLNLYIQRAQTTNTNSSSCSDVSSHTWGGGSFARVHIGRWLTMIIWSSPASSSLCSSSSSSDHPKLDKALDGSSPGDGPSGERPSAHSHNSQHGCTSEIVIAVGVCVVVTEMSACSQTLVVFISLLFLIKPGISVRLLFQ